MIINRRIFIQTALVGAPALKARTAWKPLPPCHALPSSAQVGGHGTDPNQVVFRIDGWDCCDDIAAKDQVSIRINQSWRTAWR